MKHLFTQIGCKLALQPDICGAPDFHPPSYDFVRKLAHRRGGNGFIGEGEVRHAVLAGKLLHVIDNLAGITVLISPSGANVIGTESTFAPVTSAG